MKMTNGVSDHIWKIVALVLCSVIAVSSQQKSIKCDKKFAPLGGCVNDKCPGGYECNFADYQCCIPEKANGTGSGPQVVTQRASLKLLQPLKQSGQPIPPQQQQIQQQQNSGSSSASNDSNNKSEDRSGSGSGSAGFSQQQQQQTAEQQIEQQARQHQVRFQQQRQLEQVFQQLNPQQQLQFQQQLQQPPTVPLVANINPPLASGGITPPYALYNGSYFAGGQIAAPPSQSTQQLGQL